VKVKSKIKMLEFKNAEVAEKFESKVAEDRQIHKIGVYSGPLSNISLKMAEALVSGKSNLLKPKPAKASNTSANAAVKDK
jgi:hypothetical protein